MGGGKYTLIGNDRERSGTRETEGTEDRGRRPGSGHPKRTQRDGAKPRGNDRERSGTTGTIGNEGNGGNGGQAAATRLRHPERTQRDGGEACKERTSAASEPRERSETWLRAFPEEPSRASDPPSPRLRRARRVGGSAFAFSYGGQAGGKAPRKRRERSGTTGTIGNEGNGGNGGQGAATWLRPSRAHSKGWGEAPRKRRERLRTIGNDRKRKTGAFDRAQAIPSVVEGWGQSPEETTGTIENDRERSGTEDRGLDQDQAIPSALKEMGRSLSGANERQRVSLANVTRLGRGNFRRSRVERVTRLRQGYGGQGEQGVVGYFDFSRIRKVGSRR